MTVVSFASYLGGLRLLGQQAACGLRVPPFPGAPTQAQGPLQLLGPQAMPTLVTPAAPPMSLAQAQQQVAPQQQILLPVPPFAAA